ncbi:hypothetical protein ACFE04_006460 [Oxalis oulophora]
MANNNVNGEPHTAPHPGQWYNINLGSSFKNHFSPKFCTLRYEFKPASIDKTQPGTLNKSKDNRVNVEFQNIQPGKPKVTFNGVSEDYKDNNDAVLFFDGDTFRLERLHRAVKRLRHNRLPGDYVSSTSADLSPARKREKVTPLSKGTFRQVPAQVQWIEVGGPDSIEPKNENNTGDPYSYGEYTPSPPKPSTASPHTKNYEFDEHVDILDDDDGTIKTETASEKKFTGLDIDINLLPHQADETDDEIADVDDIIELDKGPNAAEALRAQMNAEIRKGDGTSSSGSTDSSGSGSSSGSESLSSSSESGTSVSVNSI